MKIQVNEDTRRHRRWIGPLVALALLGAALPVQAQGRGRCVNVVSPRPFVLPDG